MAKEKQKLSVGDTLKTLRTILGIYYRMSPVRFFIFLFVSTYRNVQNLGYIYIYARAVDSIIRIVEESGQLTDLWPYFFLMIGYMLLNSLINALYTYSRRYMYRYGRTTIDLVFIEKINELGIQTLENPDVTNLLKRTQESMYEGSAVLWYTFDLFGSIIRAIGSGLLLLTTIPVFIPILIIVSIIKFIPERHFNKKDFDWYYDYTEGERKAKASRDMLTNPVTLSEISIIDAYLNLRNKYNSFYKFFNDGLHDIIIKSEVTGFLLSIIDTVIKISGYIVSLTLVISKQITIGTAMLYVSFLENFSAAMQDILNNTSVINSFLLKMNDLTKFFNLKPTTIDGSQSLELLTSAPAIEFKDVTFKYTNTEKNILNTFNLEIKSGEKIAIVGHNGAGKTTFAKLLSRIYLPTDGKILINGTDLREIKTKDWNKNIGILFQEYNLYSHFTAKESIAIGDTTKEIHDELVIEAAKSADAHDFILEFPNKYDQLLSERFEGGIRPSTGQSQKIALARFFYRNAPVVIFDEPTAAIDAVSEYKIFNQIYNFFKNKTVVIISHRFSTVRNADRIIVMEKGQIKEQGSHAELMKINGIYANAFNLQAEGYKS